MTDSLSPRARRQRELLSVPATARLLGISAATLYRCIAAEEFPAVRIRSRIVVPAEAVERMRHVALSEHRLVDAAEYARGADAA